MKKIQFLEKLQIDLSGGSVTSENLDKFDLDFLAARVNDVFNIALFQIYQSVKDIGRDGSPKNFRVFDSLCKTYKSVAVTYDADRDEYYSVLPAGLSSIPQNIAIRAISPMKNPKGGFIQISSTDLTVLSELPVLALTSDKIKYYLEGNKVYYYPYDDFTAVLMKLVVPFNEYEDDDNIPEPVMWKASLYDMVLSSLSGVQITPQDLKNNNVNEVK